MLFKVFIGVVIIWVTLFIISKVKSLHEPYFNWLKKQKPAARRRMVWVARMVAFAPIVVLVGLSLLELISFVLTKTQSLEDVYSLLFVTGLFTGVALSLLFIVITWILSRIHQNAEDRIRNKARIQRMMEVKR